jgi:putative SOS response-associated peptidase YedK
MGDWRSPSGERVRSFAIITTAPNELCAQLHNRMPAMLAPESWPTWLGEEPTDEAQLKSLLAHYPADRMIAWPISARRQRQE